MSESSSSPTAGLTTSSEDYGGAYYASHLGGADAYSWESESWREFFTRMARRILAISPASSVLDVGCAKGLLVQAFVEAGADAHGVDISQHAVESSHPDVRDRLRVGSATEPIEGRYDLITCIEVLEHMESSQALDAMDEMCRATDRIVFSSSPLDLAEPTHINVHETAQWMAWFADRGFYRRTDADLGFITPWAVMLERSTLTAREVVSRYEAVVGPLIGETLAKREALLAAHREISRLEEDGGATAALTEQVELVKKFEAEVLEARHAQLLQRDHIVGIEAEIGRQNDDILRLHGALRKVTARAERLAERKKAQGKRISGLQSRLTTARDRNARLERRVAELEGAGSRSLAARVARRLRGPAR
ncbi:class I SAM-dependent methyltransferase [Nocardioides baculatus]|uniref:Methyltransferase domain-containing protein n=1 Tax=Nocardioides baculatus TaxID=2801337 RepID=A0ABS1L686_9ACTN|nr:class I SAM-dependent methyltransferase [Nocardioides baculatus]MBL0747190.1 methyltransferase domain-containing protein [Nocardioides baculatus]